MFVNLPKLLLVQSNCLRDIRDIKRSKTKQKSSPRYTTRKSSFCYGKLAADYIGHHSNALHINRLAKRNSNALHIDQDPSNAPSLTFYVLKSEPSSNDLPAARYPPTCASVALNIFYYFTCVFLYTDLILFGTGIFQWSTALDRYLRKLLCFTVQLSYKSLCDLTNMESPIREIN